MSKQDALITTLDRDPFCLANLYLAYRKAKMEAFYENSHPQALAFTAYEQDLHKNLSRLSRRLQQSPGDWADDLLFIGEHAYVPKSISTERWDDPSDGHFRALHPLKDWSQRFAEARVPAEATFRLVIRPSVDFQIVSALWILVVGYKFDAALDADTAYANRLRLSRSNGFSESSARRPNLRSAALFAPYFSAYRRWRERGLVAMEKSVTTGTDVLAITMDVEKFYHRVAPEFLLRPAFLKAVGVSVTSEQASFTSLILRAIATWYRNTPDSALRPQGAIPVGLSASKIIANVLLAEFDREISRRLAPIYYGRYVDDIFLVLKDDGGDFGAGYVAEKLERALSPMLRISAKREGPPSLVLSLPYAEDSELVFAGAKQKIFALSSLHGLDLVHQIREQIRQQSSEHRMLAEVPRTAPAMASRALLASPNAALEADALRKADAISVRRLGFSLLLSDVETYAADLPSTAWRKTRNAFYELVDRHILTPVGFFDFSGYIPRVFGLMVSCGDYSPAGRLVANLVKVVGLLEETTDVSTEPAKFNLCKAHYASALLHAALQAATQRRGRRDRSLLSELLKSLRILWPKLQVPRAGAELERKVRQILLADWGRRPYKEYWYQEQTVDENGPPIPRAIAIRRRLRLAALRRFQLTGTKLKRPHWPALAFPTRPLKFDEIALFAPDLLSDVKRLKSAIGLLRGAEVVAEAGFGFYADARSPGARHFLADDRPRKKVQVAVTSIETTERQWELAATGKQDRSLSRYQALNGLINRTIAEAPRPNVVVLPELSVPIRWGIRIARKLASNGVSFLAGVEYHRDRNSRRLRNDCVVSLTTRWPGYATHVVVLQSKFQPAHDEAKKLRRLLGAKGKLYRPKGAEARPTIYRHRGLHFTPLICSDLTDVANRHAVRGFVDVVIALEWNQDTKTFSSLVEATAADLHAYIVQVNNRTHGDSRIRCPAARDYHRDVVQVKGGALDYYVIGELDVERLRREQRRRIPKHFKPIPIGYVMAASRKTKL